MSRRKQVKRTPVASTPVVRRWDSAQNTARGVALLVGAGYALLACGYLAFMQTLMDASPLTFRHATAALLLMSALGPRLPRWIAQTFAGSRLRRAGLSIANSADSSADRREVWATATALVGLFAGVLALGFPIWIQMVSRTYAVVLHAFLWSDVTLSLFETLMLVFAALPFVAVGLFVQCVHRLRRGGSQWDQPTLSWALGGAAIGFFTMASLRQGGGSTNTTVLLGGALLLLGAVIAVLRAGDATRKADAKLVAADGEPEQGPQWPLILRFSLAVAVVAVVSIVLIWVYVVDALDAIPSGSAARVGGVLVFCLAIGLGWASRRLTTRSPGIGGFGWACALAGVSVAVGVAVLNLVTRASYSGFVHSAGIWWLGLPCAGFPLVLAARALGFGIGEILRRRAHDPDAGAGVLILVWVAAGVACLAVALVLLEHLGSYATLVAMALTLLATGGTLVVHQPCDQPLVQRARLGLIFGGVAALTFLMPIAGARWLSHRQQSRGLLWESWWMTQDARGSYANHAEHPDGTPIDGLEDLIDWYRVPHGVRIGVVSLFGRDGLTAPPGFDGQIRHLALVEDADSRMSEAAASANCDPLPALRALRAGTSRFDIVVVALSESSAEYAGTLLRNDLVGRVWSRLGPDGLLLCVLPDDAALIDAFRSDVLKRLPSALKTSARYVPLRFRASDSVLVQIAASSAGADLSRWASATELAQTPESSRSIAAR